MQAGGRGFSEKKREYGEEENRKETEKIKKRKRKKMYNKGCNNENEIKRSKRFHHKKIKFFIIKSVNKLPTI